MLNMKRITSLAAAAALAVMAFGPGAAQASTTCQFGDASEFTLSADVYTTTACIGQVAGNDSAEAVAGYFGISGWVEDSRYERDDGTYSPSGILTISDLSANFLQGSWSVSSWSGIGDAMLVLKGGNGFAAYLIDKAAGLSGEWITQALTNRGGQTPAVSHISLYTTAAPIPLPAAGFLLIGALGGLGLMARRKRKAA